MNAVQSVPSDIVALRMAHCRAESAANEARYHLAVLHYRACLEAAERREDGRAMQFFALKLADCYERMCFKEKSEHFRALAQDGNATLFG